MLSLRPLRRQLLLQYLLTVGLLAAAAEVALYVVLHWAGQRELDFALGREIEKLEAAVELEAERPKIDGLDELERSGLESHGGAWQVLLENGNTLARSRNAAQEAGDLPTLGGHELAVGELRIADAEFHGGAPVRAARLLTVRQRQPAKPSRKSAPGSELMPEHMTFDLRAVVDRAPLEAQRRRLVVYLVGGFPILLGLAGVGGIYLIRRAVRPVELAFDRERRFTGAASHELRTPLQALRSEIEITLRRERPQTEYVAALERMEVVVGRMTALVEGLLVLARAKAGHLLLGATQTSVADLRLAVEEVVRLLPGRERVSLTSAAPEGLQLRGDSLLLALAVRNLVENALLHAPEGPVEVRMTTNASGDLQLTVRDVGPGMPAEVLAMHARASADAVLPERRTGRTGLGLSITRAVVKAHGGRLLLENWQDAGCQATITLPHVPND